MTKILKKLRDKLIFVGRDIYCTVLRICPEHHTFMERVDQIHPIKDQVWVCVYCWHDEINKRGLDDTFIREHNGDLGPDWTPMGGPGGVA